MAVDFHTHIQDIKNFKLEGVKGVIPFISGYSVKGNRKGYELAKKLDLVYYLGIAPQEAQRMSREEIDREIEWIADKNEYGIGEIGLDFHWGKSGKEIEMQYYAFEKQLDLAKDLGLPIIIHSRKAEKEIIDKLIEKGIKNKVIFHFYSGKFGEAKRALDNLDAYFSIAIFPSKERKKLIKEVELERLVVETDSPYVGKTPLDVFKAIDYIAKIKEISKEEVEKKTEENAFGIFS